MTDLIIRQEELLRIINLRQILAEVEQTLARLERDVLDRFLANAGVEPGSCQVAAMDTFRARRATHASPRLEICRLLPADRWWPRPAGEAT